ncbi:MAG TPA: ABC transporter permease [Parafilimonas sp.]
MFRNYFKTAWRNIRSKKFYSIINILGLSLGITCASFLYLFISFHFSFDRYHKNAFATYRVVNEIYFDKTVHIKGASMGMYNALLADSANLRNSCVILGNNSFTITVKNGNADKRFKEDKNISFVSPSWFSMFDYTFISGDAKQLLYPNTAVITQSLANKYFDKQNPINQIIVFPNNVLIKIIGVISDAPYNSDLKSAMYVSLASYRNVFPNTQNNFFTDWSWISNNTSLYLTLNNQQSKSLVETQINNHAKINLGDNAKYYHFLLQPLADVHFNSEYGGVIQQSLLYTLMMIGFCILIIASVNYVNLSIAQQSKRLVEIGTRKVLGATPWKLFCQFITETLFTIIIAVVISVIAVSALFSVANKTLFAQSPVYIISYKNFVLFLCCLVLGLIIISGIYPAVVLSRIAIDKAFKNVTGSWKSGMLKKVLIVGQNTVACMLIVCTIIMVMQVQFLKNTDIGFNSNLVVMLPLPDTSLVKKNYLSNQLNKIPQVKSYSFCHASPSSDNDWGGSVKYDGGDWASWQGLSEVGDSSYVNTFGLHIIAGRNLREGFSTAEFLINEKMVKELGIKNPDDVLGKKLTIGEFDDKVGNIVGVVKDFNSQSLAVPISSLVIADVPGKFNSIAVKLSDGDLLHSMDAIRQNWQQVFPNDVFEYHYVDDQIANLYTKEDLQQKIVWLSAMVAIIISCLGLLGLVSLMTLQRTKEIGIRKVLGASAAGITTMLSKDFLKLVVIAIFIAMPLGWWIMNEWLTDFAYHVNISWWVFVSAGLLVILIALVTVSFQAIRAAIANPVKSLRTE